MTLPRVPRPPLAVVALAGLLLTTAAWWALALWPLGAGAPEWVARTREVCFGATGTSLPNLGGWILLLGEPIGMFAVLQVVFGRELRDGLARFHRRPAGRALSALVLVLVATGIVATIGRLRAAAQNRPEPFAVSPPLPARDTAPAPDLALLDQTGGRTRLADYRGRWVIVTFAFGHCDDICPLIVQQARRARAEAGRADIPLLVVTLDPWRDTPDRLPNLAATWELAPGDRALSDAVETVTATLDAWGIPRARDPDTGEISHGSTVVLVDPAGRAAWRLDGAPQRLREALARAG